MEPGIVEGSADCSSLSSLSVPLHPKNGVHAASSSESMWIKRFRPASEALSNAELEKSSSMCVAKSSSSFKDFSDYSLYASEKRIASHYLTTKAAALEGQNDVVMEKQAMEEKKPNIVSLRENQHLRPVAIRALGSNTVIWYNRSK